MLPGGVLGILGGGQLGRMTAMAARSYGYRVQALDPDPACPARFVVDCCVTADFEDARAAAGMARGCDVVTLEIERVSPDALRAAAAFAPLRPSAEVLYIIQDRGRQKRWLAQHGFPVGPFRVATAQAELVAAIAELAPDPGSTCVVKKAGGGYDGRGQLDVRSAADAPLAWQVLEGAPCVVERKLALAHELSVLVARCPSGELRTFPAALNHHEQSVLRWSVLPVPESALPRELLAEATELASALAQELAVEGLLAVELFVTEGGALLINELAPRPHNTFHATERACATSQFEQHVRAICDLPLGETALIKPAAIVNLLGEVWLRSHPPRFERALSMPTLRLHLYEKRTPRTGRKMGHLSALGDTPEQALERVLLAGQALQEDVDEDVQRADVPGVLPLRGT
jgi:5-(carboxyamino)imidazole ribonucleotide synthase